MKILIYESSGFKARANSGKTRLNRRINANPAKKSNLGRILCRFKGVLGGGVVSCGLMVLNRSMGILAQAPKMAIKGK